MDLVTDYKINSHFSWVDMRLCFVNYLNIWAISFIKNSQNVCKFLESQSSEAVKSMKIDIVKNFGVQKL